MNNTYPLINHYSQTHQLKLDHCSCCHYCEIDKTALRQLLQQEQLEQYQTMFADTLIFVFEKTIAQQRELILAIEEVVNLPDYQQLVLEHAPESAQFKPKAQGGLLGYDFHLTATNPQLIEINTNAGGALLNALLIGTQNKQLRQTIETNLLNLFYTEWQLENKNKELQTIAIVDEQPEQQYLLPEFILFKRLFERHGITTVICDAADLVYRDHALWYGELCIDLVYNRLTDFALENKQYQALCSAYLHNDVVLTPHPRAHSLYANKKNLAILTNKTLLQHLNVSQETIDILLSGIAYTFCVYPEDAESLWANRKQLFFKPSTGYGSKAVYRGDKLTKRVFTEILAGDYVAQTLIPPSERKYLKFDMRQYVYQGQIVLSSGRLYQGQTTNFRTVGGGFARIQIVSDPQSSSCQELNVQVKC